MNESDIAEIRKLMDDAMQRAYDKGDKGAMGQWNTFNYIAKSPDAKAWGAGTQIGTQLLQQLKSQADYYLEVIGEVKVFANVIEQYLKKQESINSGKF